MVHLTRITKQHGAHVLYADSSMRIGRNEKIGLVGPNGAGKTTVFRLIMKMESPDTGEVTVADRVTVGYFSQDVAEMRGRSVLEEVKAGAGKVSEIGAEMHVLEQKLQTPMEEDEMNKVLERYGEIQLQFDQLGGYDLETRAKEILGGLGFHKNEFDKPVETFSGGWMMRVALAKILCLRPDVLLMDEPTNHLDLESIVWLEEWLREYKGSLLMTSHDRDFMNRIVSRIIAIGDLGQKTITSYTGNYDFYEQQKNLKKVQIEAEYQKQQDMMARSQEFIDRFAARASHAAQVQSRVKMLDKLDKVELPPEDRTIEFEFPVPPRSGNDVVKFESLAKRWGDKPVFSGVSGTVRRMDKIAVVGINGAGKSTLLKIVTGQSEPTDGSCTIGASVSLAYFSQHSLDLLDPRKSAYEEVFNRVPNATIGFVRNLLGAFLFSGDDVHKKISVLSGGEKSRVLLACMLATPCNLLILDEPTNHLDIKSREMLLKALKNYEGTVMLVSHDRHFLREVTNRVFEVDHGALHVYEGNYEYYIGKRGYLAREA